MNRLKIKKKKIYIIVRHTYILISYTVRHFNFTHRSLKLRTKCALRDMLGSIADNNYNNIYLPQLGCYPVAVVILHVNKT